jgi:hypothetical protein
MALGAGKSPEFDAGRILDPERTDVGADAFNRSFMQFAPLALTGFID